jgi:hypothetical protein
MIKTHILAGLTATCMALAGLGLPPALGQNIGDSDTSATVLKKVPKTANDEGYVLEQFPDRLPDTTNQCIFFRTLYDWKPLNRHNLIVWAPSRKHPYHLQLDRPCQNLRFAHTIGFTSNNGRLCGFGGDSVLVTSGGGLPDRCPIGSITKLDEEGLERLLAQGRGRTLREKREAEAKISETEDQ